MNIAEDQLARLLDFGYTEVEARFLYLVATHSGYFAVRQFLDFARAKSGKRNARLVEKLFSLGHASAQRYTRRSLVYHLCSRQLYSAIGKADLRNRREHELAHIKTLMRTSRTCEPTGHCSGSFRASNFSTFPPRRVCRRKQLNSFRCLSKVRASRI